MSVPRPEHPFPQFVRENWINLNGRWEFEFDFGKSGVEREFYNREHLNSEINVPFCPESKRSGVGYVDFIPAVWYRRDFEVPEVWKRGRVLLHLGAVDYLSRVYLNGVLAAVHRGGYSPFTVDITPFLGENRNSLYVYAEDATIGQPRGKQSGTYYSQACDYTRTTGIWQTVWLEYVPDTYIENAKYFPDLLASSIGVELKLNGDAVLELTASYEGRIVGSISRRCDSGSVCVTLPLKELHLWEPGNGQLYDLELRYGSDVVKSYFGMREVNIEGHRFLINGKPVFQRLVLDQGFYPDGIYTAPTDADLENDVLLALSLGFNGARLHQKVFEPRFLYHCDRHGYIVWGEYASWGVETTSANGYFDFSCEWPDIVARDFSHPAIIGWCPFNETWNRGQLSDNIAMAYRLTKALDPTRPCLDTSGGFHVKTDVFDFHDYSQKSELIDFTKESIDSLTARINAHSQYKNAKFGESSTFAPLKYDGKRPLFISEYGGIGWDSDAVGGWGYGDRPNTPEEFTQRYKALTDVLLDCEYLFGFCYTQLYDIEQEVNGLCTYSRKLKFDPEFFKKVNSRKAKYEK